MVAMPARRTAAGLGTSGSPMPRERTSSMLASKSKKDSSPEGGMAQIRRER
jgi:hypothetical protein